MPLYSKEQAEAIKKVLETNSKRQYQIIEYWGKLGMYYIRRKPEVKKPK